MFHLFQLGRPSILDAIGLDRDVAALSGGQRTKVLLAKNLLEQPRVLLLDEPTNHLDVVAKEELKRALKAYKGTVVLVCHEPDFYEDWVTKVWNVEEWSQQTV
ncbi:ATPase subunit of ABC transporter with duplicated ATPase domains [Neobacillus niacini]|nr:ATPase subunit of ABC transporter with duplicated ATPase domains [Neobacillus niacini]